MRNANLVQEALQADALQSLQDGLAHLLNQWDGTDYLPSEGAKAILTWLLRHEGIYEALSAVRDSGSYPQAVQPDLHKLMDAQFPSGHGMAASSSV